MPEPSHVDSPSGKSPGRWMPLAAGVALALLAGVSEAMVAAMAALLAQPAVALGMRGLRGGVLPAGAGLRRDLLALGTLWALAMAATALLVGWPLAALLASRGASLGSV